MKSICSSLLIAFLLCFISSIESFSELENNIHYNAHDGRKSFEFNGSKPVNLFVHFPQYRSNSQVQPCSLEQVLVCAYQGATIAALCNNQKWIYKGCSYCDTSAGPTQHKCMGMYGN